MNIPPKPYAATSPRPRPHIYRRGNIRYGKLWLILTWCCLEFMDGLLYVITPEAGKIRVLGQLAGAGLMNSFLSGGVWFRQNWCRYIYIFILFFRCFVNLILLPDLVRSGKVDRTFLMILVLHLFVSAGAATVLIVSRDIKRLSNRLLD